jgi:FtsZ-interacting cell division protein ZipA
MSDKMPAKAKCSAIRTVINFFLALAIIVVMMAWFMAGTGLAAQDDENLPDNSLGTPDRGNGDTVKNGRDEQGNVIMETHHARKPQQMPDMGPIYVVPQVNGPGPRPRTQQPGANPVILPAPAQPGQHPAQPASQNRTQPAGQSQSQPTSQSQTQPAGQSQVQPSSQNQTPSAGQGQTQ